LTDDTLNIDGDVGDRATVRGALWQRRNGARSKNQTTVSGRIDSVMSNNSIDGSGRPDLKR